MTRPTICAILDFKKSPRRKGIVLKKLLLVSLTLIILVAALTAFFVLPASAETYSGTCGAQGDNLTWTLDTETGVMTISGTGEMKNYGSSSMPWYSYQNSIKTVVIENGVTSIGNYAFKDCSELTSITIPEGVTSIGVRACSDCSSLTSITIPEGVTSIGARAFSDCSSLTSITIPSSVTSIGDYAFYGCSSLKTVYNYSSLNIAKGSTTYGHVAYYADTVYSVEMYEGTCGNQGGNLQWSLNSSTGILAITGTGKMADYNNSNGSNGNLLAPWYDNRGKIKTVMIGNGVTSIGHFAFQDCTQLTAITIPDGVKTIGAWAFAFCEKLVSIDLPESIVSFGAWCFRNCYALTSIVIPSGVTELVQGTFGICNGLTSVYIPSGMKKIDSATFTDCSSLTSIAIPASVTTIGDYAFRGCTALKTVYNCSSLNIAKGNTNHGYVAYYADNVYQHKPDTTATCTTAWTCTVCAKLMPALGHMSGSEATCTTAQKCNRCNMVLAAALGHTTGAAATCTTSQFCTVCRVELASALGHTLGEAATAIPFAVERSRARLFCADCEYFAITSSTLSVKLTLLKPKPCKPATTAFA